MANLALGFQLFKSGHGLGQRRMAAPVQQVQINAIHPQALTALLESTQHALAAGVHGQHLADQKRLRLQRRPVPQGIANQLLGQAVAIHLGRVYHGHALLQPGQQGGLLILPAASSLAQMPAAHAQICMLLQKRQCILCVAQAHGKPFKKALIATSYKR